MLLRSMYYTDVHSTVRVVMVNTTVLYASTEDLDVHIQCNHCPDCMGSHQEHHMGGRTGRTL